jgi:hypothetical protein
MTMGFGMCDMSGGASKGGRMGSKLGSITGEKHAEVELDLPESPASTARRFRTPSIAPVAVPHQYSPVGSRLFPPFIFILRLLLLSQRLSSLYHHY